MRIAISGFQHETNTFAAGKATWDSFSHGGPWPAMVSGSALFEVMAGTNIPVAGFAAAAKACKHTLVPTTWAAAGPSAHVTRDAYERIAAMILDGVRQALPLDAVYLDLHGAMVAEHLDDGEGELLRRMRELVGHDMPLVASLDLHANITAQMVRSAEVLIAYRTYPHVDMADTGARVFAYLQRRFDGRPPAKVARRRIPFLIPLCWQSTEMEPASGLYRRLGALESEAIPSLSFAPGFPAADFPECGPVVLAYGLTERDADRAADTLASAVIAAESGFAGKLYQPDEAVIRAIEIAETAKRPTVIADTQDNPGGGGSSDTTGILRALIRNHARAAAIGLIVDPPAADAAHAAGAGNRLHLSLGGHSGIPGDSPLEGEFLVETLAGGHLDATGPFYRGLHMNLGPSACLRIDDIRIVLTSARVQLADQAMFRFVGIEPREQAILVLKSSAHFRADFAPIAEQILLCTAPGAMLADPAQLPWTRLGEGMRLAPLGPTFHALTVPPPPPVST